MRRILTFALIGATAGCSNMNQQWHTGCTVTHKDVLYKSANGNASREYRLSTSCGTFRVGDSLAGGFNSWDTWIGLQEGRTYDLRTGGYRIGLFSKFPNVIEVRDSGGVR